MYHILKKNTFEQTMVEYWPELTEAVCGPFVITKEHETAEGAHVTRDLTCRIRVRLNDEI